MASPSTTFSSCGQSSNNQVFSRVATDRLDNGDLYNGEIGYRHGQVELIISFYTMEGGSEIEKFEGYASETYLAVSDGTTSYVLAFPLASGASIGANQGLCKPDGTHFETFWLGSNARKVTLDGTNYSYSAPPDIKNRTTYKLAMFETYAEANSVFNPQPEKKISPAEIAGIVVFVLVTIGGIGLVLFFVFRKRSGGSSDSDENNMAVPPPSSSIMAVPPPSSSINSSATPTNSSST